MGEHTTGIIGYLNPICFAFQQVTAKEEEITQRLTHQRLKSLQGTQEKSSRAFTLLQPSSSLARHSPEHTDELGGHELRAELLHLCYIAQKAQHIAMQLLLLWELLGKQRTGLYKVELWWC